MSQASPDWVTEPFIADVCWDCQIAICVHGAHLELGRAGRHMFTQICGCLELRGHQANLTLALLPVLQSCLTNMMYFYNGSDLKQCSTKMLHAMHLILKELVFDRSHCKSKCGTVGGLTEACDVALSMQIVGELQHDLKWKHFNMSQFVT